MKKKKRKREEERYGRRKIILGNDKQCYEENTEEY